MTFGKRGLQKIAKEVKSEGNIERYTKIKAERRAITSILVFTAIACSFLFWVGYVVSNVTPEERVERERVRREQIATREKENERGIARQQAAYNKVCGTGNNIAAFVMIQDAVRSRLKSPSTASFPYYNNSVVASGGDCSWEILSYVDAQNSFGATIRSAWVGKIRHYPDTGRWRVLSVNIAN